MRHLPVLLCFLGLLILISPSNDLSCEKRYGENCRSCKDEECTECNIGHCGLVCSDNCTGSCSHVCHKTNCSCTACADGYYGDNCSSSCSGRCYKAAKSPIRLCERNGACSDGCKYGFCLPNTACSTRCSDCVDDDCDSDTCKCRKGFKPSLDCENCRDQTCRGGVCIGCKDGYHGEHCEKKCTNCDICYQLDGKCILCNECSLIWCWTCTGIAVVGIIALVVCLYQLKVRGSGHSPVSNGSDIL